MANKSLEKKEVKGLKLFFKSFSTKQTVWFVIGAVLYVLQLKIQLSNMYFDLLLKALFTGVMSNALLCVAFFGTDEFEYIKAMVQTIIHRVKHD